MFDASAAVKLVLDETDSDVARLIWDEAETVVAPTVMPIEVAAAISAARRAERLGSRAAASAHGVWRELAGAFDLRTVDATLADAASDLAERHSARGMDAIYLATVAELDEEDSPAALASFDGRQRAAALTAGLAVLPAPTDDERRPPSR